jgi:GT2 family glycosyltransferase
MAPATPGSPDGARSDQVRVAVVMPVRGDAPAYRRALAAVAAAAPPPDAVVIVSDGPPHDASLPARAAGFIVVELPACAGPAAARNAGVARVDADVVLFVDADVAVAPDLIARVREVMADGSIAAAVGCYDTQFPERNFFSRYKHLLQRFVHLDARGEGSTFWGACGAMRRTVFLAANGFDERFRYPSVEDIDLGYRVRAAGQRIVFRPDLQVTHLKRWTLRSLVASDVWRRALPWTWLLVREGRVDSTLNVNQRSRIAAGLSWMVVATVLTGVIVAPWTLILSAAALVGLAALDWRLLRFFGQHGGPGFVVGAFAWHWVYYLYSSATLVMGILSYPFVSGGFAPAAPPTRSLAGTPTPLRSRGLARFARSRLFSRRGTNRADGGSA